MDSNNLAIPYEEAQLAKLVCTKLSLILQGTMSLGLSSCLTGIPPPKQFLLERHETIRSFLMVLRSLTGPPSSGRVLGLLREEVKQLVDLANHLQETFNGLVGWKETPFIQTQKGSDELVAIYGKLFQSLWNCLQLVGIELSFNEEVQRGRLMAEQFLVAVSREIGNGTDINS